MKKMVTHAKVQDLFLSVLEEHKVLWGAHTRTHVTETDLKQNRSYALIGELSIQLC